MSRSGAPPSASHREHRCGHVGAAQCGVARERKNFRARRIEPDARASKCACNYRVAVEVGRERCAVADDGVVSADDVRRARSRCRRRWRDQVRHLRTELPVRSILFVLIRRRPFFARAHRATDHIGPTREVEKISVRGDHRIHIGARGPRFGRCLALCIFRHADRNTRRAKIRDRERAVTVIDERHSRKRRRDIRMRDLRQKRDREQ